jgi:hypothetical protein
MDADPVSRLVRAVSVGGAYTYLSARDSRSGLALTGRNPHQGHVRVSWQPARVGLRASVRGTSFSSWIATRTITGGAVHDTVAPRFALWDAIHDVLRRANTRNLAETRRLSAQWLRRLKSRSHSDSAALIREDRDRR